jgi:hypothetical protein
MKKLFTCLGVVFAVIILAFIVLFAVFIPRAFKLGNEATAYIQTEVPKIVKHWNAQGLVDRATPDLIAAAKSREDLDRMFVMFQQLGSLKHLDTPSGGVHIGASTNHGSATIANFTADAEFEKGPATISIQLLRTDDTWKINGFRIESNVFLPPAQNKEPQR